MKYRRFHVYSLCVGLMIIIYYMCGVSDYIQARSFDNDFDYPLNINIRPIVEDVIAGRRPNVAPINIYPHRFLTNSGKCKTLEKLDVFVVVKSAVKHFGHRRAIRRTYGQEHLLPGRIVRLLFFLGIEPQRTSVQEQINEEIKTHKDIIQMDFHDSYFNNTIKTMMSFKWVFHHCPTADFYLFTDDDMYISVGNLLNYVHEMTVPKKASSSTDSSDLLVSERDEHLYAGYVFRTAPHRHLTSKWKVSVDEYPWDKWPAYVTAGAYVVSNKSMRYLYLASLYVKHFRFDDVYLGIVAKKVGIQPQHCSQFYFYKKKYDKERYKDVIASHGFSDHEELVKVWNEQNAVT